MSTTPPDLFALGADVPWPDHDAATRTRDELAGNPGLGRLAELASWLSGVLPDASRRESTRVRAVVLGAAGELTSAIAEALGVGLRGSRPAEDATVDDGIAAGVALADEEIDGGADLLVAACPDTGPAAATVVAVLTNTEPVKVLGRGASAIDPVAWSARAVEVRDARRRCYPLRDQPQALLAALGNPTLAAVTGFLLRAAARRTPVVLDGSAAAAAALLAYEAQPRAVNWWLSADRSPDPAHALTLTKLAHRPVLDLGTGLGDGTAGLLAVPVLRAALRLTC